MNIAENVQRVQDEIASACARANRNPDEITLVAVSKRKPVDDVLAAIEAGLQHFGENRVEEAETKIPEVAKRLADSPLPTWHMVGHVQSRKAKDVLPLFPVTHSLDSVKLASKIARLARKMNIEPKVFLQVNVSGEASKYGFDGQGWQTNPAKCETLFQEFDEIFALSSICIQGLMTMAPYGAPETETRQVFASLMALQERLRDRYQVPLPAVSMGMTDDYPIAIEEGATIIRVGRALFGEREYE